MLKDIRPWYEFENYWLKITAASSRANELKRNMSSGVERFIGGSTWMTIKIVYRILLFIIKVVDVTDVDIVNI